VTESDVCSRLDSPSSTGLTDDRPSAFNEFDKVRKASRHGGSAEIADDMVSAKGQSGADYFWTEAQTGTRLASLSLFFSFISN